MNTKERDLKASELFKQISDLYSEDNPRQRFSQLNIICKFYSQAIKEQITDEKEAIMLDVMTIEHMVPIVRLVSGPDSPAAQAVMLLSKLTSHSSLAKLKEMKRKNEQSMGKSDVCEGCNG